MTMGERIQSLRTGCGLSQEQLAGLVGVSRQAVSKWERGEAIPDTNKLAALAGALGTTADELLGAQTQEVSREERQSAEKNRPGWLAIHWHWLGVPVCLWGAAVLIRAILGLSIASRMAEGAADPALVLGGDPGSAAWGIGLWIQAGCRAAPVPAAERSGSSAVHEFWT